MIKLCMLTQIWSATDIIFCHFRPFFALLPHYWPQKLKFGKNVKNTWRYYPFTHVYHKSRSYDVWFLRYKVQRTEFFVILGHFYPLTLLTTQKIKIWKNEKNSWRYYHFKHEYHKWKSYDVWFVRYSLGPSFALLHPPLSRPLTTQRIKILKKWKKHLEISSFYTSVP